jgi:hypothetical protein
VLIVSYLLATMRAMVEVLSVGAGAADMVAMVHVFRWSAVYLYQRRQRHREFRLRGVWSSAPFHARVVVVILWHVYGSMVGVDLVLGSMFAGSGLARLLLGVVSVLMLIMRVGYRWVEVIVILQLVLVGLAGKWGVGDDCYHRLFIVRWNFRGGRW